MSDIHMTMTRTEATQTLDTLRRILAEVTMENDGSYMTSVLTVRRAIVRYEQLLECGYIKTTFGTMRLLAERKDS